MTEDEKELAWAAHERPIDEALEVTLQGHPSLQVRMCRLHDLVRGDCEDCSEDPEAEEYIEDGGYLVEFVVVASILRPNGLRALRAGSSPGLPLHTAYGLLSTVAENYR